MMRAPAAMFANVDFLSLAAERHGFSPLRNGVRPRRSGAAPRPAPLPSSWGEGRPTAGSPGSARRWPARPVRASRGCPTATRLRHLPSTAHYTPPTSSRLSSCDVAGHGPDLRAAHLPPSTASRARDSGIGSGVRLKHHGAGRWRARPGDADHAGRAFTQREGGLLASERPPRPAPRRPVPPVAQQSRQSSSEIRAGRLHRGRDPTRSSPAPGRSGSAPIALVFLNAKHEQVATDEVPEGVAAD